MKKELSPALIAASIAVFVLLVGGILFFAMSDHKASSHPTYTRKNMPGPPPQN